MKSRLKHVQRANVAVLLTVSSFSVRLALAQAPLEQPASSQAAATQPESDEPSNDRILGVIPNYLTVEDSARNVAPLTVKEKFRLFAKETIDPFTGLSAAAGAALSQVDNQNPKYGEGAGPYAERFGAAAADIATQNFFQDAVFASLLHEDPRYFRRGPEFGVWYRVGYALSRVVVTRTDAGKN